MTFYAIYELANSKNHTVNNKYMKKKQKSLAVILCCLIRNKKAVSGDGRNFAEEDVAIRQFSHVADLILDILVPNINKPQLYKKGHSCPISDSSTQ